LKRRPGSSRQIARITDVAPVANQTVPELFSHDRKEVLQGLRPALPTPSFTKWRLKAQSLSLIRFEYAEAIFHTDFPKDPMDVVLHGLLG